MITRQSMRRLLALLLCLSMVIGLVPMIQTAKAVEAEAVTTYCEDHDPAHEGWLELPSTGGALSGNYYVKEDMDLTGMIETKGNVHICLNGKTISFTGSSQNVIDVSNGCTVTICDCKGSGKIDAANATGTDVRGIFRVRAASYLNVYGGTYVNCTANYKAGGARVAGTFNMYGGQISGNTCADGPGGIFVEEDGVFVMNGGSITGNSGNYGGAIYVKGGSATINGGSITDNTVVFRAWVSGAAAYVNEGGTLTINGGTISGNMLADTTSSWSYPNTIDVEGGNFVMTGGSISCVTANGVMLRDGAANTYAISGSARIDEAAFRLRATENNTGTISNLKADASVWVKKYQLTVPEGDETVIVSGETDGPWLYTGKDMSACCDAHDRTHEGWQELPNTGAALKGNYYVKEDMDLTGMIETNGNVHICLNGKTVNYTGSSKYILEVYTGCTVTICDCVGGGKLDASGATGTEGRSIFNVRATATLNIYGGTFTGRTSNAKAGGVSTSGVFNMYGGEISGNTYTNGDGYGGAVFVDSGATFNMEGGTISGNKAIRGGAIYASGGTIQISGGTISGNTSTDTDRLQDIYMTSASSLKFTGSPVFENVTVRFGSSDTATISNLTEGASIYLPTDQSSKVTTDLSVGAEADEETGLTHYTYEEPPVGGEEGESDIRVLSIGNSYSRDVMYYLGQLGKLTGKDIMAAYLYKGSATIRDHAYNLAHEEEAYSYYKTDLETGKLEGITSASIQQALADGEWDVILLHQGTISVGFPTTYNSDLEYIIDYVKAEQPNAEIDWMMTWAFQNNFSSEDFETFYNSDQNTMYNGIISTLDECIVGEGADFADDIQSYIPVGAALQNLRATYGDTLTRDGYHLSLEAGRLTAAMTLLLSLYPDTNMDLITVDALSGILEEHDMYGDTSLDDTADAYDKTDENHLTKVKAAVLAACQVAAAGKVPEKLDTEPANTNTADGVITVAQVEAPLSLFFSPVASLKQGTLIAAAYESSVHVQTYGLGGLQEGPGRIVVFDGSSDGQEWSYDDPLLVIDEKYLHEKGVVSLYNRYELLQANPGANPCVFADPRDPNLLTIYMDMDGDNVKEEILTLTFWVRFMDDTGDYYDSGWTYLIHSTDGGETWSDPYKITANETGMTQTLKRGTLAYFGDDRQVLVPVYADNLVASVLLEWDVENQVWVKQGANLIPDTSDELGKMTEVSFVSPKGDNVVYAFVRTSGAVLKSTDLGVTWTEIGNEDGFINQPGFILLDENRVFTTWAVPDDVYPRDIYGKIFYVNGSWSDSPSNLIYASPERLQHDAGDPSAALMADGRVFVVSYDSVYRSIVGVIVDPNEDKWQAIELQDCPASEIFSQTYEDQDLTEAVTLPENLPGSYTIELEVEFTSADASVSIPTAAGTVTVTPTKVACGEETEVALALNTKTYIRISVVSNLAYVKVWQTSQEPADWTLVGSGEASQTLNITGTDALLANLKVSRKIVLYLRETLEGTECTATTVLQDYQIQPSTYTSLTFTSSDPTVASVDETGVVSFLKPGTAEITMTVDGVSAVCRVTVNEGPMEITGNGETKILLQDDYESYTVGTDAFWDAYWADPENSLYEMRNRVQSATDTANKGTGVYSIVEDDGNQYLSLTGKTWHTTKIDVVGDYTVQYDFKMSTEVKNTGANITMWQRSNDDPDEPNQVHMFVNMDTNHFRLNYRAERLDVDDSTETNPHIYDPLAGYFYGDYNALEWCTMKMVRVDGYFYVKIWNKYNDDGSLAEEPEAWDIILEHDVLDTDVVSNLRISLSAGDLMMDNLLITQQVEEESAVTATRMELGNELNMQFAVPADQQSDWTDAYAEIVGGGRTVTIPYADWQYSSVDDVYVLTFNGVAAKEMTDKLTVTIYDKNGDRIGASYTDSVRDYVMRNFDKHGDKVNTLFADMLNYGAEAQKYFGYKTDDLANAEMTAIQQGYATQAAPSVENTSVTGTVSRLDLVSRITLQIVIDEQYKDQTITYSFNNYKGVASGEIQAKVYSSGDKYYIIADAIVLADARQTVTVKADNTVIAEDSVECYIARMSSTNDMAALCTAIMKFADAAKAYFTS